MRQYPSQQNSFEDGMHKDIPLELIKPNQYIEAQNLRIVSVEAGSTEFDSSETNVLYGKSFKLTNLKGDLAYFQLPNTPTCTKRCLVIDAQEDLTIIGWYATANELILITTAFLNKDAPDIKTIFYPTPTNPTAPTGKTLPSVGQIWRIDISDYEAITINPTPELVYNDYLNLYLEHQIQQVYIVETDCIRRLFWTDNYNPPRNLELTQVPQFTDIDEDNDTECLLPTEIVRDPELLDFNPKVCFGKIDFLGYGSGGDLPEGVYQYTYRYLTKDGNATPYFQLSRKIILAGNNHGESWIDTDGRDVDKETNRTIKIKINDVDRNFEEIEIVVAFSIALNIVKSIYVAEKKKLSGIQGDDFLFEHRTDDDKFGIEVTEADITVNKLSIVRAKSLLTVNNRMLAANFCEREEIELPAQPNIQFTHVTKYLRSDIGEGQVSDSALHNREFGHSRRSGTTDFLPVFNPNAVFEGENDFVDFKGGNANYYKQGYWRDELYRFGIVFHYKDGSYSFAYHLDTGTANKDFKFPNIKDEPLSYFDNTRWFLRSLGLKITGLDLSTIKDKIKGFSIVRAVRTDADKSIICQGIVLKLIKHTITDLGDQPDVEFYRPSESKISCFPTEYLNDKGKRNIGGESQNVIFLYSPDLDFNQSRSGITNELVQIIGKYHCKPIKVDPSFVGVFPDGRGFLDKAYSYDSGLFDTKSEILESRYISTFSSGNIGGINISLKNTVTGMPRYGGGSAIELETSLTSLIVDGIGEFNCIVDYFTAINIKKKNPVQYGGNNPDSFAQTVYIPTGHYQAVKDDDDATGVSVNGQYEAEVFGGDCFVNFYSRIIMYDDPSRHTVAFSNNAPRPPLPEALLIIFPVESNINTNLRYDNRDPDDNVLNPIVERMGVGADFITLQDPEKDINLEEAFLQKDVYNLQESLQFYPARPIDFNVNCQTCFPHQIIASRPKSIGEKVNSWTSFLTNERVEVDLQYGGITHIDSLTDDSRKVLFWQEFAGFGGVSVGTQAMKVNTGTEVTLGTGTYFATPQYISERVGCKHKWSILRTRAGFYWYDANTKSLYNFAGNKLADLAEEKGMKNWFYEHLPCIANIDNPIYLGGVHLGIDTLHEELLITFIPALIRTYGKTDMCLTATLITDAQGIYTLEIGKYYRHVETDGVYLSSINGTFPNIAPTQFPALPSGIVAVPCPNFVTNTYATLTPCDANPEINQKWTLCFNENTQKFTSFYTRYPRLYMNLSGDRLLAQYPSDGTTAFIPNIFTLGKDAEARNAFWGFNEIINTSYLVFALNKDKDITKLPSHLIMNSNRLWTTLELVNTEQFDIYGGVVGIRGSMPMNILGEPRGGKWFVPYPEGTDIFRNGNWANQQVMTRISGEQLLVKLTCNEILFVGGDPNTVLDDFFVIDRSLYEIFDVMSYFTASKRNS